MFFYTCKATYSSFFISLAFGLSAFADTGRIHFQSTLQKYGLTAKTIAIIESKAQHQRLTLTEKNSVEVLDWLKGQNVQDPNKPLSVFPALLSYSTARLALQVDWLKAQGVQKISKLLTQYPAVLGYGIKGNLDIKVAWLREQGVQDIGAFLSKVPQVAGYSLEENLAPKAEHLKTDWDIAMPQIERINARVLGASLVRLRALSQGLRTLSYDVRTIPITERIKIAYSSSIEDVLENLRNAGIIRSDAQSVEQLPGEEVKAVKSMVSKKTFLLKFLKKNKKNGCNKTLLSKGAPHATRLL